LQGGAKIAEALYEHPSGTKIIPSSLSIKELKNVDLAGLKEIGKKLKKMADFVILDSAAGLGQEALAAIESGEESIIITNPEITAVTDALKTSKIIEQMGGEVKGVIVTRVKGLKTEMPIASIRDMLELPILGVIPEDNRVQEALVMKDALIHTHPKSRSSRAYRTIAARISGNSNYKERISFWERIFG
jgi:septum site-determining protein MinD